MIKLAKSSLNSLQEREDNGSAASCPCF